MINTSSQRRVILAFEFHAMSSEEQEENRAK